LQALVQLYGHVEGANTLFDALEQADETGDQPPEFFSNHPHTVNRIEYITAMASEHHWPTTGAITPFPPQFSSWLAQPGL